MFIIVVLPCAIVFFNRCYKKGNIQLKIISYHIVIDAIKTTMVTRPTTSVIYGLSAKVTHYKLKNSIGRIYFLLH